MRAKSYVTKAITIVTFSPYKGILCCLLLNFYEYPDKSLLMLQLKFFIH